MSANTPEEPIPAVPNNTPPQHQISDILGPHWTITPLTWTWTKGNAGAGAFNLLILDTPIGRLGFAFEEGDLEKFIRTAQTQLTGLVLPVGGLPTL